MAEVKREIGGGLFRFPVPGENMALQKNTAQHDELVLLTPRATSSIKTSKGLKKALRQLAGSGSIQGHDKHYNPQGKIGPLTVTGRNVIGDSFPRGARP